MWVGAFVVLSGVMGASTQAAHAETRTLKLYYIHTKERAEITYKRNGRYIQSGLDQINRFLRDWRRNEPTKMDPRLMDILWEVYQRSGARDHIHVVSAYRSPATNAMLRSRSSGVAERSQHTLGRAVDFYIPGVQLSRLRAEALRLQGGGVGYYPRSGAPFVHLDVGNVRHWPRMSRQELAQVFPNGRTLHVPTDGKPLPGYEQALADAKQRTRSGGTIQVAEEARRRPGGFLSALFGGGADEAEEESGAVAVASAAPRQQARNQQRQAPQPAAGLPGVAANQAPAQEAVSPVAPQADNPERIIASLPARAIPLPVAAPRPSVGVGEVAVASVLPASAPAETETQDAAQVALNIPIPTNRPTDLPVREPTVVTAALETESAADNAIAAYAPVPATRPRQPGGSPLADMVSAIPRAAPERQLQDGGTASKSERVLAAAAPGTMRAALQDETATGAIPNRTTPKSAKPGAGDAKRDARAVVVPADREAARWAMEAAVRAQRAIGMPVTPSTAHDAIRAPAKVVYTDGFRSDGSRPEAQRFTGKAVNFMSVARFSTN